VSGEGTAQGSLDFVATDERAGFRLHRLESTTGAPFISASGAWCLAETTPAHGRYRLGQVDIGRCHHHLAGPAAEDCLQQGRRRRHARAYSPFVCSWPLQDGRGDVGLSARPVSLRDSNSYSVLLARFFNEGYDQTVTLAQVFWLKDMEGQPAKLFVVSDGALSIAEHFANFGTDIADLRKRLRRTPKTEIFDAFAPTRRPFVGASASRTTRRWIYSTRRCP